MTADDNWVTCTGCGVKCPPDIATQIRTAVALGYEYEHYCPVCVPWVVPSKGDDDLTQM